MSDRGRSLARRGSVAALVLVSILAAGCLGRGSQRETPLALDATELRTLGSLTICTDATRPPLEYRGSDGVLRGFEVDLMTEIARRLDVSAAWVDMSRSEIVDAVVAGTCDSAASTLAVRRDGRGSLGRMAAIAYLGAPVSLLVRRGERPLATTGLCGRRVGAFASSLEHDLLLEAARSCREQGRSRLELVSPTSTPAALAALRAGDLDAILDEHPVSSWFARRQTDRFDLAWILGEELVQWAIGAGIEKEGLYHAIRAALRELDRDGTFRLLLERWGLDRAGVVPLPIP